jgi:hypothetical protein
VAAEDDALEGDLELLLDHEPSLGSKAARAV